MLKSICVALAVAVFAANQCMATEEAVSLTGTVSVERDDTEQITKIELQVNDDTCYEVKLDRKGLELAEFEGETIYVIGILRCDEKTVLIVTEFRR